MNVMHRCLARLRALPLVVAMLLPVGVQAQTSGPRAVALVSAAVEAELAANHYDNVPWMYKDHDKQPGKDAVYQVVETPQGELRRMIELNGQPVTGAAAQAETDRINEFLNSPRAQEKARKAGQKDDADTATIMRLMPQQFVWTTAGESGGLTTLNFYPNPKFDPPNMQAKVFGQMKGEMIVGTKDHRIRTLRGELSEDVLIAYGLIGRMKKGGTFDAEHREIMPGHWQIETLHVHIGGHALMFTVGSQEDEFKTDWKVSPAKTLAEAARILGAGK